MYSKICVPGKIRIPVTDMSAYPYLSHTKTVPALLYTVTHTVLSFAVMGTAGQLLLQPPGCFKGTRYLAVSQNQIW